MCRFLRSVDTNLRQAVMQQLKNQSDRYFSPWAISTACAPLSCNLSLKKEILKSSEHIHLLSKPCRNMSKQPLIVSVRSSSRNTIQDISAGRMYAPYWQGCRGLVGKHQLLLHICEPCATSIVYLQIEKACSSGVASTSHA